jgi:hypothetical protein
MPLHSDYLAPTFLITLLFVQIFFIIYFNYKALRNYGENQIIYLTGTDPQCEIQGLPNLNPENECVQGRTYGVGNYYITTPQNTYVIGKTPKTNVSVCSKLCTSSGASITKTGDCSKNIANYTNCLAELVPIDGCKQAERPLAKIDVSPSQTVYYYAQAVLTNPNDC